jgi:fumarylacetoacetase
LNELPNLLMSSTNQNTWDNLARLQSWVESANDGQTDFPIQNLPFGVFRDRRRSEARIGVAIGDRILDLRACREKGLLDSLSGDLADACTASCLNDLMALGATHWSALRTRLVDLLGTPAHRSSIEPLLVPMTDAEMLLPAVIGDYTDFYASIHHATRVGTLFRPDNPLLPNYKYLPIGYHGRASSIVVSGNNVRRPRGQKKPPTANTPIFGPSTALDYELEVGFFVGPGNALGEPIPIESAQSHIFGICLFNDWSARDIQSWEYQPLGPFLGKNFATTISPWVVTMEALAPFRVPAFKRPPGDPAPLPYLQSPQQDDTGAIDLTLEVYLTSAQMRASRIEPVPMSSANLRDLYWTPAQMLTHHASNGCNLRPGDLFASGTVSGPAKDSLGCLLEVTKNGAEPLTLSTGETRRFLEDGDEVIFQGFCRRPGFPRIGLGPCRGTILPALK